MNVKTILSLILVGFVTVSIVYVLFTTTAPKGDNPASDTTEQATEASSKTACNGCANGENCSEEPVPCESSEQKTVRAGTQESIPSTATASTVVYYFHGEVRCTTCRTIEEYTKQVLHTDFDTNLDDKSLSFIDINLDEEGNEHFVGDYSLSSSSLVVAHFVNGKRTEWKNLEKIWTLVQNEMEFKEYARTEIRNYLTPKAS